MIQRKKPIVIQYEEDDQMTHSIEKPICEDDSCICAMCEYEILARSTKPKPKRTKRTLLERTYDTDAADLNYRNRGFRLLR